MNSRVVRTTGCTALAPLLHFACSRFPLIIEWTFLLSTCGSGADLCLGRGGGKAAASKRREGGGEGEEVVRARCNVPRGLQRTTRRGVDGTDLFQQVGAQVKVQLCEEAITASLPNNSKGSVDGRNSALVATTALFTARRRQCATTHQLPLDLKAREGGCR